jgi:DNA-binding transcriptional LysR family regulator
MVVDRLDAMSILVATVEQGSLSGAGRSLGVPLPTVSRKIAELEARVGARLLIRSTRKLTLTDAGAGYVTACRRILDDVTAAERAAAGEYSTPRGDLVVAAPIVFGRLHVLPVAAEFLAQNPQVRVRLALSDRNTDLIDDHIDVAVRIGDLRDSTLVATRVGAVRPVVCGSPAYFAAHGEPRTPEDLEEHACIAFDSLWAPDGWTFARAGSRAARPVAVRPRLSVNTAEAAIDAAVAGVGITRVLSYQAARAIAEGRLRAVLTDFEGAVAPVSLVHAGQSRLPLKTRAFLDLAAVRLRAALELGAG